jgi:hypothetical protein
MWLGLGEGVPGLRRADGLDAAGGDAAARAPPRRCGAGSRRASADPRDGRDTAFNRFRAITLRHYARAARVAFPIEAWIAQSEKKARLEGGGFGKPKPRLFPGEHGRHLQRAFRDMLADLIPLEHDYAPTRLE